MAKKEERILALLLMDTHQKESTAILLYGWSFRHKYHFIHCQSSLFQVSFCQVISNYSVHYSKPKKVWVPLNSHTPIAPS